MLRSFIALLTSVLCFGTLGFAKSTVIFTRHTVPAGWSLQHRADSAAKVNFFLALKQQNLDALDAKFWSVSDPNSAEYRQFLSTEQINAIVAPKQCDVADVTEWLLINGVTANEFSVFGDSVEVHTSVAVTERLFQTRMYEFHNSQWKRSVIRQYGSFSLPSNIRAIVDLVMGLTNFPRFSHKTSQHNNPQPFSTSVRGDDDEAYVPQTTYALYNIPPASVQKASNTTSQAAISILTGTFAPEDLALYSKLVGVPVVPLTPDHIIGEKVPVIGYSESTANMEWLASVNTQATSWFWVEDGSTWFYSFCVHFLNTTNIPQVISLETGWWEGDTCEMAGDECAELGVDDFGYVTRVNTELQKFGLRGVSVLAASGDSGAHTRKDIDCLTQSLRVDFPASSPFVTSVGATQLTATTPLVPQPAICAKAEMTCAASGTEIAVSFDKEGISSGGGFSQVTAQPAYQSAAVKQYLSSGVQLPPSTYYNTSNRAHPDVSALGGWNLMFLGNTGGVQIEVGTTVSTPIFAAVVALLNEASIAQSGQPLGFLNPLLYQIAAQQPKAFNDITVGDNVCSEHGCLPSCTGFFATAGWDPVTGLGTPNYAVLLQEIKKLGHRNTKC